MQNSVAAPLDTYDSVKLAAFVALLRRDRIFGLSRAELAEIL
jgi:hypothetical protein